MHTSHILTLNRKSFDWYRIKICTYSSSIDSSNTFRHYICLFYVFRFFFCSFYTCMVWIWFLWFQKCILSSVLFLVWVYVFLFILEGRYFAHKLETKHTGLLIILVARFIEGFIQNFQIPLQKISELWEVYSHYAARALRASPHLHRAEQALANASEKVG